MKMKKIEKYVKAANNALILFLMGGLLLALLVVYLRMSGAGAAVGGRSMYRILTGSMEPTFRAGDYVIARETDPASLAAGDIVVFISEAPGSEGEIVLHRIVSIEPDGRLVTRGDANPLKDTTSVDPSRLLGRVSRRLVLLSLADRLLSNTAVFLLLIFLPLAFMIINETVRLIYRYRLRAALRGGIAAFGLDPGDERLLDIAERFGPDAIRAIAEAAAPPEKDTNAKP